MRPSRPLLLTLALAACSSPPPVEDSDLPTAVAVRFAPDTTRADLPPEVRRVCAAPAEAVEGVHRPAPGARAVEFREVRDEDHSGLEISLRCVVRTADEWTAVARSGRLAPADLAGGTLIVAAMGRQPATNRYLAVDRITMRGDTATVSVVAHYSPSGSDLVTTPLTVVRLPARPNVVEFVETYRNDS